MKSNRVLPQHRAFLGRVALIFGTNALAAVIVVLLVNLTTQSPTGVGDNLTETSTTAGAGTNASVTSVMERPESLPSSSTPNHSSPSLITPTQSANTPFQLSPESAAPDLAAVVEQSRNAIQTPSGGRPPFISRPSHQASFQEGRLAFTPLGASGPVEPLVIELAAVTLGSQSLLTGSMAAAATIDGNIATYNYGPNLVEEFVARDSGIEQHWHIKQSPQAGGDLVISVEVQTDLAIAPAPGGRGFTFRAIDPITGEIAEIAHYGRAVAIDANGETIPANLSYTIHPASYDLIMTFPADWLAEAAYPILVDPLISSAVQLDEGGIEADQSQPAVAYNSADDEFLVVWQDDRNGTDDIFAQRVDGNGNLVGDNITVNAAIGNQTLPDVAYNPDQNNYLVVWRDGTEAIWGQTVENDGDLMGTVRNLADSAITRNYPAVSYSSSDNAWLTVWQEWDGGTSSYRLQARAVRGSDGTLQTTFTVYNNGSDSVTPDVSANGSGGFLVAWEQTIISDTDIYARRAISTAVDGGTIVLTSTTDAQVAPAVTYNPDDDEYLVAWQDLDGAKDTVWGRQVTGITATNPFVGNAFQVNSGAFDAQVPAVAYFTPGVVVNGTYLVSWKRPGGSGGTLVAQRVLTDTTNNGSGFTITPVSPNEPADVALGYGPTITATLAAWTSELGGHYDVAAARITAGGSVSSEFVIHPQPDDQERPEVAYNPDDQEYLVVWHDYRAGEADPNIFGQRVSITGTLLGDNITITMTAYRQLYPKVAYGDGVYLVAWTHYPGLSDTDFDAYAGIISPTGTVVTNSLVISTGTAPNSQAQPTDIVYNSTTQQFLVLYQDKTITQFNIWGRHVDSGGSMGSPIQITSQNSVAETNAAGAYNPDDDHYLVVWEYAGNTIYGRRMTGAGVVSTTETIAIANTAVTEEKPDVVYLNDQTGYVVVWSVSTGTSREVYGRVVTAGGTMPIATYQISSGAQADKLPRLGRDGEGGALVIWHLRIDFDTNDLYGRRLSSDGQPLGSQFTILEMADSRQMYPALAGNGSGQYFLAWQDDRNGNWDIYGQPFQHLTADFTASPTSGLAPLTVVFTDTSVPTDAADLWHWDFGDGSVATTQNPTHTYTQTAIFTVTLTITDTDTSETDTEIKIGYITTQLTNWSQFATTNAPTVFGEYVMAYDSNRAVTVLYGGNASGWPYKDITWEFDGSDWETITTTQNPPAVYGASMVYDSDRQKMVLFGGSSNTDVPLTQTWEYSGTDWVQVVLTTTPQARTNAALVYDPVGGQSYLFGGLNGGTYYSDTWVYNGSSWSQVSINGQSPSARALHAMAYDPNDNTILLFGGRTITGSLLADLWRFDPNTVTWTEINDTGPSARFGHSLAYFPEIEAFVLVGGTDDGGDTILDDTWHYLSGTGWIEANPVNTPPAVVYHVVVYDGSREAVILVTNGETWEYK